MINTISNFFNKKYKEKIHIDEEIEKNREQNKEVDRNIALNTESIGRLTGVVSTGTTYQMVGVTGTMASCSGMASCTGMGVTGTMASCIGLHQWNGQYSINSSNINTSRIDYSNYIAGIVDNNNINFNEYLSRQLDISINYTNYIARDINGYYTSCQEPSFKNVKRVYSDIDPYGEEIWD